MSTLVRRGATYHVVIPVPADLHAAIGQKQKWKSTHTKDRQEATRRMTAIVDEIHAAFDDMRRRRDLTDADMGVAVWEHYSTSLDMDEQERASRPTPAEIHAAYERAQIDGHRSDAFDSGLIASINAMTDAEILAGKSEWAARRRTARLNRLRSDLATGDTRLIEPDADKFLIKHGFKIERSGARYRDLCHKLMRADIERLERAVERDRGDFTGKPRDPIVAPPANMPEPIGTVGDSIMELFAKYERENPRGIRPETFDNIRRDVQHFATFVGARTRPSKISKAMVRNWKDLLAEWPVKAAEMTAFKGLGMREILAANKKLEHPKPAIGRGTIIRYLTSLQSFCSWLVKNDYLQVNPVSGMVPEKDETSDVATFTDQALARLFASPLFTTCKSDQWADLHKPGNVAVRDHRYWIPYVMLYSGARPSEVAQLRVGDVREQHGHWVMHITVQGGKRTKTKSSMRLVPIHDELVRLGFVEHCRRVADAGEKQVFPEIEIPEKGQIAARFSRDFSRYLEKAGVKSSDNIVPYSFRHTFIDRARIAGFLDNEIGIIVGHGQATMTGRYGNEQEGTLKRRVEIVNAIRYQTIDKSPR